MSEAVETPPEVDYTRRFAGVARLYGAEGLARLQAAHVCVVGIGGVGSWAAEALARTAVGALTLIDLDMVAESNVNRQIHALGDEFGKAKVRAMAERIAAINPACRVHEVEDFVTEENLDALLGAGYDYVIDAIDQTRIKVAMIARCVERGIPIVTAGGAGGQIDPTRITIADLSRTEQDPLLAKVRSQLRKTYGFPRDPRRKFGVEAVYSDEPLRAPGAGEGAACDARPAGSGLNCAGYGSSVCITAPFGLFAAGIVLRRLTQA